MWTTLGNPAAAAVDLAAAINADGHLEVFDLVATHSFDRSGPAILLGRSCVWRACGGKCSLCGSRANCRVFADDLSHRQQSEGEQHEDESAQPPLHERLP